MRIERLVTESESHSIALDFHPRLTVVGGLDEHDRARLVEEVLAGLAGERSGIHLELLADSGARFAVFRPSTARHRIVGIDTRLDVTENFADAEGRIDLLAHSDLSVDTARAAIRLRAADLLAATDQERMVQALANVNQNELWVAADALVAAQRQLESEAAAAAEESADNEAADELEARHEELENLRIRLQQFARITAIVGAVGILGSIAGTVTGTAVVAAPLLAIVAAMVARVTLMRRKVRRLAEAETEALSEFGAASYLGFHIQRVNGLFDSDQARRSLMNAAENQRAAYARWTQVAGTADVTWALRHRAEIDAAARVRREVFGSDIPNDTPEGREVVLIAHSIVRRLAELRRLGVGEESFPAIFDEPFADHDPEAIAPLLELLVRSSEQQQIVLLTNSPAIVSWARVESMAGGVALLEPNGPTASAAGSAPATTARTVESSTGAEPTAARSDDTPSTTEEPTPSGGA